MKFWYKNTQYTGWQHRNITRWWPNCKSNRFVTEWYLSNVLQFSRWALVLQPKTSKISFGPVNFFTFYLELYKNKFKNLIWTNKFKFSFGGLVLYFLVYLLPCKTTFFLLKIFIKLWSRSYTYWIAMYPYSSPSLVRPHFLRGIASHGAGGGGGGGGGNLVVLYYLYESEI